MPNFLQDAINSALSGDWPKAIAANQTILKEDKNNINSLSRLAHAYVQMGKVDEAKKLYRKILTLDKYNYLAQKKLDKLNSLPRKIKIYLKNSPNSKVLSPSLFIEEPGKTKTISLKNPAPTSILPHLNPGDLVMFCPKKYSVDVRNLSHEYIGALPDDSAFKIIRLLKAGYEYEAYIKNVTKNNISLFIKEIKRAKRFASQPSFVTSVLNPQRNKPGGQAKNVSDLDEEENSSGLENQEEEEE